MIFAEVASRVGLLGKVNLPREPSERASGRGGEENRFGEVEKESEGSDGGGGRRKEKEKERKLTASAAWKSSTKLRRCISPFVQRPR